MTEPLGLRRRRRVRTGEESIPDELAEWFAGKTPMQTESGQWLFTPERLAALASMPPESLNRLERLALGLSVPEEHANPPWCALIYPDSVFLLERWRAWKRGKGRVKPPPGYEWLDGPKRAEPEWLLKAARAIAARGRR